jgi:hypothetical protein
MGKIKQDVILYFGRTNLGSLSSQQLLILSILLFFSVVILGCLCMLATGAFVM